MSEKKIGRLGRRFAIMVGALALMTAFGVTTASASINVTSEVEGHFPAFGFTPVVVHGTPPAGTAEEATDVAIVVCDTAAPGTKCDIASATPGLLPIEDYENEEIQINVRKGPWDNWSFAGPEPKKVEGKTTCKTTAGAGPQCAIFVSYYETVGGKPVQVANEHQNIWFN